MPAKWLPPDTDDFVRRYLSGASINQLAGQYRVSRTPITRSLVELGVELRDQSASETMKWKRMCDFERKRQVIAAHAAVRGKPKSEIAKIKLATTVANKPRNIGQGERQLADMLRKRGRDLVPQQAIGPYNCDIGAFPVAVEVFGGNWHWSGRHLARTSARFRYLMDRGWSIFVVRVSKTEPIIERTADEIVAFIQRTCANPTAPREYRVIGGTGKFIAAGRSTDNEISIIPATTNALDPATGRYKSVPRETLRM